MRSLIAALTLFALGIAVILTLATANVAYPKGTTPTQCTPPCVAPTCVRT